MKDKMKKSVNKGLVLLILLVALCASSFTVGVLPVRASPSTYWVQAGAVGDGTLEATPAGNITWVITDQPGRAWNISAGDVIKVKPGTYNVGIGEFFPIVVEDADLTIQSTNGASVTIIDAGANAGIIHIKAANVTIGGMGAGFTITNNWATAPAATGYDVDYGILVGATTGVAGATGGVKIQGNIFHVKGNGVTLCSEANSTQTDKAQILDNTFEVGWDAVRTADLPGGNLVHYVELLRNNITATGLVAGDMGFVLESAANVTVGNNRFTGCDAALYLTANYAGAIGATVTASGFTISGNTFTNCPRGILVWSGTNVIGGPCTISNVDISMNTFSGGDKAIWVRKSDTDGFINNTDINYNNIHGHTEYGVLNDFTTVVDARMNWWGDVSGPGGVGVAGGAGDHISNNVDYSPWLDSQYPSGSAIGGTGNSQAFSGSGTLDAKSEADTTVTVTGSGDVEVGAVKYSRNPTGSSISGDIGKYFDVHINTTTGVTSLTLRFYYTDDDLEGKTESSLKMYWWNGSYWVLCDPQTLHMGAVNGYSGYIEVIVTDASTPTLNQLIGTPFGISGPVTVGGIVVDNDFAPFALWIAVATIAIATIVTATIGIKKRKD